MNVDPELKQYLIGMETRMTSSLKGHVDERLAHLESYVNERSEQVETKLLRYMDERVAHLESYVNERCEEVETKLLTEFHKWASPADARNRTISAALRAIDLEMESLSDRVKKLEGPKPQ